MQRRIVPDAPRFRLRWLATRGATWPDWIEDDRWVPSGSWAVYTRVKNGLRAVLDDLDRDGPVLLPSYAPGGVAWAALDAGFDVRYYPVSEDLSLPLDAVRGRFETVDPAVVVFIHFFGFVDHSFDELREAASDRGALVVEDCARGLFSRDDDGRLLGSTGDVALYCLHKTLPAPNGGLVVAGERDLPDPSGTRSERWTAVRCGCATALETAGLQLSYTTPVLENGKHDPSTVAPSPELEAPGGLSMRAIERSDPETVAEIRLSRYRDLRERLVEADVRVVTPAAGDGAVPYGVAILADSETQRTDLYAELYERRLPGQVLTWPPVHRHAEVSGHDGALALRRRLVVLPTHQQIPTSRIEDLADVTAEYLG